MSDTDITSAPDGEGLNPDGTFTSDERGIRLAAAHAEAKAAVAAIDARYNPPAPEIPPEGKRIVDDGASPLSHQRAAALKTQEDADRRAQAYREGLADPSAAWAGNAANQAGESPQSIADPSAEAPTDPVAAERQALEAERAHFEQERQAAQWVTTLSETEQQLWIAEQNQAARLQATANQFNDRYADLAAYLNNPAAMQWLQQNDSARHAQLVQDTAVLQNEAAQYQQAQQHRAQVSQQRSAASETQFAKAAELHDAAWLSRHEELRDPAKLREIQQHAQKYFEKKGLSREELEAHWHGRKSFSLREAFSQDVITDAIKWDLAQQKLKESRNNGRELPPVQRPGVSQPSSGKHQQIEGYNRAISRSRGQEQLKLLAARQSLLQRQR